MSLCGFNGTFHSNFYHFGSSSEFCFLDGLGLAGSQGSLQHGVLDFDSPPLLPLDHPRPGGDDVHLGLVRHEWRQRTSQDDDQVDHDPGKKRYFNFCYKSVLNKVNLWYLVTAAIPKLTKWKGRSRLLPSSSGRSKLYLWNIVKHRKNFVSKDYFKSMSGNFLKLILRYLCS